MKHYNKEINLPMAYDDEENDMYAIENNNTININSNHFESDIDTIRITSYNVCYTKLLRWE